MYLIHFNDLTTDYDEGSTTYLGRYVPTATTDRYVHTNLIYTHTIYIHTDGLIAYLIKVERHIVRDDLRY